MKHIWVIEVRPKLGKWVPVRLCYTRSVARYIQRTNYKRGTSRIKQYFRPDEGE